jgi:hypothetical protein
MLTFENYFHSFGVNSRLSAARRDGPLYPVPFGTWLYRYFPRSIPGWMGPNEHPFQWLMALLPLLAASPASGAALSCRASGLAQIGLGVSLFLAPHLLQTKCLAISGTGMRLGSRKISGLS